MEKGRYARSFCPFPPRNHDIRRSTRVLRSLSTFANVQHVKILSSPSILDPRAKPRPLLHPTVPSRQNRSSRTAIFLSPRTFAGKTRGTHVRTGFFYRHFIPAGEPRKIGPRNYGRDAQLGFFSPQRRVTFITPTRGFPYRPCDGDTND